MEKKEYSGCAAVRLSAGGGEIAGYFGGESDAAACFSGFLSSGASACPQD